MRISISIKKIKVQKGWALTIGKVDNIFIFSVRHHSCCQHSNVNVQAQVFIEKGIFCFNS